MIRFLAIIALGGLIAGCSKVDSPFGGPGGRHSWTKPNQLRVAIQQDLKNLNTILSSNTTDVAIDRLMFEPLLSVDPKGNPVPILAADVPTLENRGVSKDGLTITYHLRKAKWTDGQPVTSKDVKFSWQAIVNPNNNVVSRHGYDYIRAVDTPNAATVIVHLKQKFSPFVNTFFADSDQPFMVVPEHVLGKYANLNQIPFNNAPTVSDGPFKFVEWAKGDHIKLVRNDGFFLGRPKLKTITFRIIPDEDTSVNLLKTHDVDWIFEASVQTHPGVTSTQYINNYFVDVNGYEDIQLNLSHPFLKDVRVRQAIAYAVDKKQLVDTLTYGTQKIASEDIPDWHWAYDPSVTSYPLDLGKAKALLTQAGWTPGPDGYVQKNGQRMTLTLVSNVSNVTRRKYTVLLQSMLKQVGIDVRVKYYPGQQLFAPAGMGGILQLGNFDISAAGWYAGIDPDDSSQFTCKNFPPGGYNYPRYCNPDMEAAQKMALENYDQATRKQAYAKIQALLARDVPEIFFWWTKQSQPISLDFKGFSPNPVTETWNAWQWSI